MNKPLLAALTLALLGTMNLAFARGGYNDVPTDDPQYRQCISYANKNYEGGNEKSPVAGQSKVQAFCECMWNETSDDFRGNLAKFAESEKGKKINKLCEKHSNWSD